MAFNTYTNAETLEPISKDFPSVKQPSVKSRRAAQQVFSTEYAEPILDIADIQGAGEASNWIVGGDKNPHILIQIASDRLCLIQEEIYSLESGLISCGNPAMITYREYGKRRDDLPGHEHFGYLDGISNPGLRGVYKLHDERDKPLYVTPRFLDAKDPRVDMYGLPGQHLIWPGEVILGLPKQHEVTSSGNPSKDNQPGSSDFIGPPWARNGSYLVYRRLRQDVVKFWQFLRSSAVDIAKEPGMRDFGDELMGAKLISRWKSGMMSFWTKSSEKHKNAQERYYYVSH